MNIEPKCQRNMTTRIGCFLFSRHTSKYVGIDATCIDEQKCQQMLPTYSKCSEHKWRNIYVFIWFSTVIQYLDLKCDAAGAAAAGPLQRARYAATAAVIIPGVT